MTAVLPSLVAASLLTIGGSTGSDEVSVIPAGCMDKDWYVHFMPSHTATAYNSRAGMGGRTLEVMTRLATYPSYSLHKDLDSNLLPVGTPRHETFGTVCYLPTTYAAPYEHSQEGTCGELFAGFEETEGFWVTSASKGYYPKNRYSNRVGVEIPGITPYLGVGSRIPTSLSEENLTALMVLLNNPSEIQAIVVGDCATALSVLGAGLVGVRAWLVNHLGVIPGKTSIGLDTCIPFVYSTFATAPTPLQLFSTDSRSRVELRALKEHVGLMWASVLYDFEYLGATPLGDDNPKICFHWGSCISVDGKSSRLPFNHPWVVLLMGLERGSTTNPTPLNAQQLLETKTLLALETTLTCLRTVTPLGDLVRAMPGLSRAFAIQMYRKLSKRGHISFPAASDFPKRTDISKVLYGSYVEYMKQNKLKDFIDVYELLWEKSLWTAVMQWSSTAQTAFCFISRTSGMPLSKLLSTPQEELELEAEGPLGEAEFLSAVAKQDSGNLLRCALADAPPNVQVVLRDNFGVPLGTTNLEEIFEGVLKAHETVLSKRLSEHPYSILSLIAASRLKTGTDSFGKIGGWLKLNKVDLGTGWGCGIPLSSLVPFYRATGSAAVRSILQMVITLLMGKVLLDPSLHAKGDTQLTPPDRVRDTLCSLHIVNYLEDLLKEKPDPD